MKKRIAILAFGLLMATASQAQIYMTEGETNEFRDPTNDIGIVPYHGVTQDQGFYTPMGNGILLLTALGGAYLIGRKRKGQD